MALTSKRFAASAVAATAILTAPAIALSTSSAAAPSSVGNWHVSKVLSTAFVGPLQFAVQNNAVYVADSFTSTLRKVGSPRVIARGFSPAKGGDLSGVAVDPAHNEMAYLESNGSHSFTAIVVLRNGKPVFTRNLALYEAQHNPDGGVHYGVRNPSPCVRDALIKAHVPVSYTGEKDSHPYAVAYLGQHRWAVADAGGNDILIVNSATGSIRTLTVLPREAFKVTPAFASANKLPSCTIGVTYYLESVPTDVEIGPHNLIYATALPGGGGPGSPPQGRVYVIRLGGKTHAIGFGFASATNLAVTPTGQVYVAELGAGKIATIKNGFPAPIVSLPSVVAVEFSHGLLYASTAPGANGQKGPGRVVVLTR